jgi:Uma2 family endonuclease
MRTLVCDPPPADIEAFLERRKRLGQDRRDEVWEGVLHVMPAAGLRHGQIAQKLAEVLGPLARAAGLVAAIEFNLGDSKDDFRVPDGGLLDPSAAGVCLPTAALVIEILSPGDESWEKLPFYAAHRVDELLIIDPDAHEVHWLALTGGRYEPTEHSRLIDLSPTKLARQIDWP